MRTMGKVTVLFAVIALAFTMTVAAQSGTVVENFDSLNSNTRLATAGIFKTDVDNYLDVHSWGRILGEDNTWFGFATQKSSRLNLGYARNFGDIYVGAWYQGRLFNITNGSEINTLTPTYNDNGQILTQTITTTTYTDAWINSANQLEVLLGISGHGIKVGIFESLYSNKHDGVGNDTTRVVSVTDFLDGRVQYQNTTDEYTNNGGYIRPYVGWGSAFTVSGLNLRPYADFGLTIYNDETIDNYNNYWTLNGVKQDVTTTVGAGNNRGYLMPAIKVGAKLDLNHEGGKASVIGLEYGINIYSYNNDYNATGVSGSVDGTVSWGTGGTISRNTFVGGTQTVATTGTLNVSEISDMSHSITPSYQLTGRVAENFRLGFSASLPITIRSQSSNNYTETRSVTKINYSSGSFGDTTTTNWTRNYGTNTETSTFTTALNLGLGASYQLIPERFTVNAGIRLTPVYYTNTVVTTLGRSVGSESSTKIVDEFGNVLANEKTATAATTNTADVVNSNSVWNFLNGGIAGGFVFYFTPAIALDLLIGASTTGSTLTTSNANFNLDIASVNVLLTFKF